MLHILWDTRGYFFWLLVISAGCLIVERIRPWRKGQKLFRTAYWPARNECPTQQPDSLVSVFSLPPSRIL